MHGCESSSGDNELAFTNNASLDASNGFSTKNSYIEVSIYSQVTQIPAKYNYSGSMSGPYLLETQETDGELDGLEFSKLTGEVLIDGSIDYFTSADYSTKNGDEETKDFRLGEHSSLSENNTMFDSLTDAEIGHEITNEEYAVEGVFTADNSFKI